MAYFQKYSYKIRKCTPECGDPHTNDDDTPMGVSRNFILKRAHEGFRGLVSAKIAEIEAWRVYDPRIEQQTEVHDHR